MNKFIKNIVVFSSLLLMFNFLGYQVVYKYYLEYYEEVNLDYSNYLLGDSQGKAVSDFGENYGIYNFCDDSDSYEDIYRKFTFLQNNSVFDTLFITVNNHTLSEYREKKNNEDRSRAFVQYESIAGELKFLIFDRYLVLTNSKFRDVIKVGLLAESSKVKEENWASVKIEDRERLAVRRIKNQFQNKIQSKKMKEFLEKIVKECQENNIVLIGVKFPLSEEVNLNIGELNFGADSVLLQNNCRIIDCAKSLEQSPSFFKNTDHVNLKGARKFWRVFIKSLTR